MAFLKIVEFVGEVLIFVINDDFKYANAVIKIMLCFSYICLPYSVMLCTMYLCISVHVSTVNHEWNDDFLCILKTDGSSVFLLFSYVIFLFCVNYSCCILLYMGSMFIYISLYILWKPTIKTIIIIIIIIRSTCKNSINDEGLRMC